MSFSPFTEDRIRTLQAGRKERDEKRAKEIERQAARTAKAEEAEKHSTFSVNAALAREQAEQRAKAVTAYYASIHERQEAREQTERHKKWWDQMVSSKRDYHDPTTSPFRRGQCVLLYAEAYRYVNGQSIEPQAVIDLWRQQEKQQVRDQVVQRLRVAVGESS